MNYRTTAQTATWQIGTRQVGNRKIGTVQNNIPRNSRSVHSSSSHLLSREAKNVDAATEALVEVKKSNLIFSALLFFALAFQIYTRLEIVNSLYKLDDLRAEKTYKQSTVSELNFALEKSYQPDLIVRNAESKLGLVITPPQRIRRLK